MRKVFNCLAVVALAAGSARAAGPVDKLAGRLAGELSAGAGTGKARVAVASFRNPDGGVSELGRMIAVAVSDRLLAAGKYTMLDRLYVGRLLEEIRLNQSGFGDQATALQAGRFGGAEYMVLGTVELYGEKELMVSARLVQTETSVIAGVARSKVKITPELKKLYESGSVAEAAAPPEKDAEGARYLEKEAAGSCRWAEARGSAPAAGGSRAARALALSVARQKAAGLASGPRQPLRMDFGDPALLGDIEKVLRLTRSAWIEEEKVVSEGASGGAYSVTLHACVRPARENADRTFKVELLLNQNRFAEGQEARALVSASGDAWLYLFSADFDGNVSAVLPGPAKLQNKIKAGEAFAFPGESHRKAGVSLVAQLPEKADSSVEILWVLAVRRDAGELLEGLGTMAGIRRALDAAGQDWAEDIRVYTIRK